ncbi:hypothetical protein E3U55_13790 [Filobacillus milosensis]|uniref:Uncharacterized protein n=1 Tax=Filobacillus milosensis TaxID=94137 RepID=A0A4Y8IE26_9BACI|nr:hypothetical protein [Filobacillus milosensis]TFB14248.1 hypothetical protein E3U55_13790 [Filobacillus milosensis]
MKKIFTLVYMLTFIFVFSEQVHLDAAMDPKEIEERKNEAPLQIIGDVKTDVLVQERDRSYPSQLRKMQLEIEQVIKKPNHFEKTKGDSISITYSYIPSWVQMEGGKRMDIMVGDRIEIWLEKRENGWKSAVWGDSVNHLKYVEPREEHIPEPFSKKINHIINESLPTLVMAVLGLFLGGVLVLIRRIATMRKGY